MKQLITLLLMSMTFVGCNQANENALIKSEFHSGTVETQDPKSMAMNAFNDAYLANDMTGQEVIFTADALALVNGVEMTPAQLMAGFLEGRTFYSDITQSNRATGTFYLDNGDVYTNTWFKWEGVSNATGVTVDSPVHASFKWDGNKVAIVSFLYDSHDYVVNMATPEEEE